MHQEDDGDELLYERTELKVRIVAYDGLIIVNPFEPEKDTMHEWWPTGGWGGNSTGGCVLGDSKKMLGISEEALALMQQVKRNRDAIGDLSWWRCDDGVYAFAWWGPVFRIVNPATAEGARDFRVYREYCTIIPNEVPEKARELIQKAKGQKSPVSWDKPEFVEYDGPGPKR